MRLSSKGGPPKPPSSPEVRAMHTKLGWLWFAVLVDLLGFSIVVPLTTFYVIDALHLRGAAAQHNPQVGFLAGMLTAVYALMQFLFAPLWGRLSDRIGRKPILIMSLVGDVVFYALFGLSVHNIYGQFAARILAGIFSSASLSVAQAYVADITPPQHRAMGMGMIGAAFGVGFLIGPAIGGLLGQVNLSLPMYVASGLALINLVYIYKMLPESRSPEERAQSAQSGPPASFAARLGLMARSLSGPIGFLYLLTFLVTFAFANLEGTFTTYLVQHFGYAQNTTTRVAGWVFAYIGLIIVVVQGGLIRPLTRRFGEASLVIAGVLCMTVGFLTFALPHHLFWLLAGPMLVLALGSGLNSPSIRSLISRKTAATDQGASLGLGASFDSLARTLGPFSGGLLYAKLGQTSPFWFAGLTMAIAFIFALSQRRGLAATQEAAPVREEVAA